MIREVDLVSYLPPFMRKYETLVKTLEAENPEFVLMWEAVDRTLKNTFITTADEYGITRYEKVFGIFPEKGETLDERRAKLLMKCNLRSPYTFAFLKAMIASAIGIDNYTIECLDEVYQVKICILNQDLRQVKNIYSMIKPLFPCNMLLLLYAEYREEVQQKIRQFLSITFITVFYPRFNTPELLLDNTWILEGKRELSGYDGGERMDFYPVCIGFETKVFVNLKEHSQVCLLLHVEQTVKSCEIMAVKASAEWTIASTQMMEIRAEAAGMLKEEMKVRFITDAEEPIESGQTTSFQLSAECRETIRECMALRHTAEVDAGAGDILIETMNMLDDSWFFDGSRELNGGNDMR